MSEENRLVQLGASAILVEAANGRPMEGYLNGLARVVLTYSIQANRRWRSAVTEVQLAHVSRRRPRLLHQIATGFNQDACLGVYPKHALRRLLPADGAGGPGRSAARLPCAAHRGGVTPTGPLPRAHNILCRPGRPHGRRQDWPGRDLTIGAQWRRARPNLCTFDHRFCSTTWLNVITLEFIESSPREL